jgi:hypothetical protein
MISLQGRVFVPGRLSQQRLMSADKVRSLLPRGRHLKGAHIGKLRLNRKHQTRLERLARDELVWNIHKLQL